MSEQRDQPAAPQVGIVMGSDSDWPTMEAAATALEEFGVAVGHRPRQPQSLTLFEHDAVDLQILGDGAAVARRRREEPQEFFGGRVEQLRQTELLVLEACDPDDLVTPRRLGEPRVEPGLNVDVVVTAPRLLHHGDSGA